MAILSAICLNIIKNILNMSTNFVVIVTSCLLIELTHALNMTYCNNIKYTDPSDTKHYCFNLCKQGTGQTDLCDQYCEEFRNCTAEVERRSRQQNAFNSAALSASVPQLLIIIVSVVCSIVVVLSVVLLAYCCYKWRHQKAVDNTEQPVDNIRIGAERPVDKSLSGELLPSEFSPVYKPTDGAAVADPLINGTTV